MVGNRSFLIALLTFSLSGWAMNQHSYPEFSYRSFSYEGVHDVISQEAIDMIWSYNDHSSGIQVGGFLLSVLDKLSFNYPDSSILPGSYSTLPEAFVDFASASREGTAFRWGRTQWLKYISEEAIYYTPSNPIAALWNDKGILNEVMSQFFYDDFVVSDFKKSGDLRAIYREGLVMQRSKKSSEQRLGFLIVKKVRVLIAKRLKVVGSGLRQRDIGKLLERGTGRSTLEVIVATSVVEKLRNVLHQVVDQLEIKRRAEVLGFLSEISDESVEEIERTPSHHLAVLTAAIQEGRIDGINVYDLEAIQGKSDKKKLTAIYQILARGSIARDAALANFDGILAASVYAANLKVVEELDSKLVVNAKKLQKSIQKQFEAAQNERVRQIHEKGLQLVSSYIDYLERSSLHLRQMQEEQIYPRVEAVLEVAAAFTTYADLQQQFDYSTFLFDSVKDMVNKIPEAMDVTQLTGLQRSIALGIELRAEGLDVPIN